MISLVDLDSIVGARIILGEGKLEDDYSDIVINESELKHGVFILDIQTEMNVLRERDIIK